jgi:hypothetical protein
MLGVQRNNSSSFHFGFIWNKVVWALYENGSTKLCKDECKILPTAQTKRINKPQSWISEDLNAVTTNSAVFRDVGPCSLVTMIYISEKRAGSILNPGRRGRKFTTNISTHLAVTTESHARRRNVQPRGTTARNPANAEMCCLQNTNLAQKVAVCT